MQPIHGGEAWLPTVSLWGSRQPARRGVTVRAILDARAVATWMVPNGMTSQLHAFDAREGGSFRISLTYDTPTGTGKTTAHTDTYQAAS